MNQAEASKLLNSPDYALDSAHSPGKGCRVRFCYGERMAVQLHVSEGKFDLDFAAPPVLASNFGGFVQAVYRCTRFINQANLQPAK